MQRGLPMTRSETLSLEPLADFSAALDGMAVVGSALDADRNLLLTACEDASEYREVHPSGRASFGRSRSSKHHHLAGLRIRNGTIDRFVVATEHLNAHFYAPLPNGGSCSRALAVVATRAETAETPISSAPMDRRCARSAATGLTCWSPAENPIYTYNAQSAGTDVICDC